MPISTNNVLTVGLKGAFGKQVVFRQRGGKTIVSNYPDMSNRKLSAKQLEVNKQMEEANYYAKGIIGNEQKRNEAQVRLNVTRNKLYTSLIREYFQTQRKTENT